MTFEDEDETSVEVFNPSDRTYQPTFNGSVVAVFEPRAKARVRASYQHQRDPQTNRLMLDKPPVLVADAMKVAKFICEKDQYGRVGFVRLRGDQTARERQMVQAREEWVRHRLVEAEGEIAEWESRIMKHNMESPGVAPPQRPLSVVRAYQDRARYRGVVAALSPRAEFICRVCSEEHSTRDAIVAHIRTEHPQSPLDDSIFESAAAAQPEPAAAPKDRRAANRLLMQAQKAGLALTVADIKGLKNGDADVIADVTARLGGSAVETKPEAVEAQAS